MSLSAHMKYPKYTHFGLRCSYVVVQAFAKQRLELNKVFFQEEGKKKSTKKAKQIHITTNLGNVLLRLKGSKKVNSFY